MASPTPTNKKKVLIKTQSNWNSYPLTLGMQNGSATVKISSELTHMLKTHTI
jgi:hypothetical protein